MNIDIRQAVINNLVNASANDVMATINDSMSITEEAVLPGLGVLFEVYWRHAQENEKSQIVNTISNNLKQ